MYEFASWYMDRRPLIKGVNGSSLERQKAPLWKSTGPVDDNTVVAFYSSSTCDLGTAIGESNAGCVSVNDSISAYKYSMSFNLTLGSNAARERWFANPPSAVDTTSLADLREQSDRFVASTHPLARQHGNISNYQGQPCKWHQVAAGAWRGIAPEDWDDSIHIRSDTVIKHSETYPMDFSMNSPITTLRCTTQVVLSSATSSTPHVAS